MVKKVSYDDLQQRVNDLQAELENYRVLIENTPDLLYRTDLEGRIIFISQSVAELSGYSVAEALGMKMAEEVYLHPEERQGFLEKLQIKGYVRNFEAQLKRKDGSVWWASTNAHFLKDKAGNILGVEGVTRDVSEIKAAEKALKKSEERFRQAFHTSPDSINLNRASDGMYLDINDGFTKIMGYTREDVIGKTSVSLNIWNDPADREYLVEQLLSKGYVENLEAKFIGKDGGIRIGLMSARTIQMNGETVILSITRDITEPKRLEMQLQQAQKFEALGTLAGGIAHDFNNLLMGIQGRASLIEVNLQPDDPMMEHVQGISEYVKSATNLTKQILGFARGGKYEIQPINANVLLGKSLAMFARTCKHIRINKKLAASQIVIEADSAQLEQVLINILVNAWQAMPDGGDIFLQTSAVDLDGAFCGLHNLSPGSYCKISITDTGTGMTDEVRRRVFDPFFTTKEIGRGTGLGLASALGIIKNHGGMITVYSEVEVGSTFNIYLPVSQKEVSQERPLEEGPLKGSGTLLFVDDEDMVVEVGREMLRALGYKVYVASDGRGAIDLLKNTEDKIDMIILDLIMPGMDGGKVFDHIRERWPDIPVLLSSGYSMNGQVTDVLQKGCDGFIQKPFTISELSKKIRGILKGEPATVA